MAHWHNFCKLHCYTAEIFYLMVDKLFQLHALGHDQEVKRKKIQKDKDCKVGHTSDTNSSGICTTGFDKTIFVFSYGFEILKNLWYYREISWKKKKVIHTKHIWNRVKALCIRHMWNRQRLDFLKHLKSYSNRTNCEVMTGK